MKFSIPIVQFAKCLGKDRQAFFVTIDRLSEWAIWQTVCNQCVLFGRMQGVIRVLQLQLKCFYFWFYSIAFLIWRRLSLKVSRSRNKIVEPKLLPKNEQTNLSFYPDDWEMLATWNGNSSFKYFQVVKVEKQIHSFVFWEKLRLNKFVSRSTDF